MRMKATACGGNSVTMRQPSGINVTAALSVRGFDTGSRASQYVDSWR
jgi:hypothetical protein